MTTQHADDNWPSLALNVAASTLPTSSTYLQCWPSTNIFLQTKSVVPSNFQVAVLAQETFKKPEIPAAKMQDEPEDLSLSAAERNSRVRFWNFVERKKRKGEIVLACSACLTVFADPLLYRMHVGTHALGRSFQCAACGTVCPDRVAFQQHLIFARHG